MKSMTVKTVALSALVAGLVASAPSFAVEAARSTMESKMSVPATCRVTAADNVDYGAYTGVRVRKTMVVTTRCNKFGPSQLISIRFDCGKNGTVSGNTCIRRMKNTNEQFANNFLEYKLYNDSSYSIELLAAGRNINYNNTSSPTAQTFYPELVANQFSAAYGSYSDDVTITVAF